jgi:HicB_like antitoxin of bacterial toxin-antitoxin system
VNVTVPEDDLERIDRFANEHGYTRSGFLLRAARHEMGLA